MKRCLVVLLTAIVSTAVRAQPTGIQRVSWLQGCWEIVSADRSVEEQWMAPRGRSMIGVSRTVRADRLMAYEFIVLREQGDQLAYQAHPSGQPSAVFLSRAVTSSSVVFENLQHDFPQRIGYRLDTPDSLAAWIEGTENGTERRIDSPTAGRRVVGRQESTDGSSKAHGPVSGDCNRSRVARQLPPSACINSNG